LTLADLTTRVRASAAHIEPIADRLVDHGLLRRVGDGAFAPTEAGTATLDRLVAARRDTLADLLKGWSPDAHPEVAELLRQLARHFLLDDDTLLRVVDRGPTPVAEPG
jgi:DNA-binding MarR family transcriptional regulator